MKRILARKIIVWLTAAALNLSPVVFAQNGKMTLPKIPKGKRYNIIFVLLDDQRYDAMGFLKGQAFLQTPNMDSIARNGVHLHSGDRRH